MPWMFICRKIILGAILLCLTPIAICATEPVSLLTEKGAIPLQRDQKSNLLIARCILNGIPCNLIVDTGASHTTFDAAFIKKYFPDIPLQPVTISAPTNVKSAPLLFPLKTFSMGGLQINHFYGMVLDLAPLRNANQISVDGILGMNYLAFHPFIFSVKNATLQFLAPDEVKNLPKQALNAVLRPSGTFDIKCTLKQQHITLLMDSGSSLSFAPLALWPEDKEAVCRTAATTDINGAEQHPIILKKGIPSTLLFGPNFSLANLSFIVTDNGARQQIGVDTLQHFDILVDAAQGKIFALPHQQPAAPVKPEA